LTAVNAVGSLNDDAELCLFSFRCLLVSI